MTQYTPAQARKMAEKLECSGPLANAAVVEALRSLADQLEQANPKPQIIELDFKQATELLEMYAGEPAVIGLSVGDGHSGRGIYAHYIEVPEEGAEFLGVADDEAMPSSATQAAGRPEYPVGEVVGPCVCGSWPGGECLKCEWIPAAPAVPAPGTPWLQELERLAEKMMRDSWATGSDAAWKPGMAALLAHAATPPQAAPVAQLSEPPEGWKINRDLDGDIFVASPLAGPGCMYPRGDQGPLSERLLHHLASSLIASTTLQKNAA